ncbi:MAG: hypothetical protein ACD_45C00678G0001 [uncultured bacterium]|nr:MAG: hypothetical protein ACD_45C00678G0001 [uncultured bacterium]
MTTFWRKVVVIIGYLAALSIIFAALVVSVTQVATPLFNDHLPDFEKFASRLLNRPVTIEHVNVVWKFYEPELVFQKVTLLDQETRKPVLTIPRVAINVALIRSLFTWQPVLGMLKISGAHITLQQTAGQVRVAGFSDFAMTDNLTGASLNTSAIGTWIFSQPELILQDIHVYFMPARGAKKSITLQWLALNNSNNQHRLAGQAILHQDIPTQMTIRFKWAGDVADLSHVSANLYLYLQGISLPQWFSQHTWHHLRIQQGLGSAKIWATWENNTWQKIQTTLQFYDLEAQSLMTKKPIIISRLSGNIAWMHDGNNQIIKGDSILIDLPHHLWPTTAFTMQYSEPVDAGSPVIQKVQVDYLDLADSHELMRSSGLLVKDYQPWLIAFNPRGEIRNVVANSQGSWDDLSKVSISANFNDFALNAWNNLPGVANIQGSIAWNGKTGESQFNSQNSIIVLDKIFANPLQFDQLTGSLYWQKDLHGAWIVTAKKLRVMNADLTAQTDATFTIPPDDASTVNLTGNFTVANASHISHYLPLKIFDPELGKWLKGAFLRGKAKAGNAILQGRLKDFPFGKESNGKFVISGVVSDVDLHYAANWPIIRHINGKLIFSGRSMIADIDSGQVLDVPIRAAHGEIDNLGESLQVLKVTGMAQADLGQGLHFIHQSPLQETIGKQLSQLQLQGPMRVALTLSVPLDDPDKTTVVGKVNFSKGKLAFPNWNFVLDQLSGAFQFTEKSLLASSITGRLFAQPMMLAFATKPDNIIATLQGNVSTADLQTWLNLPFDHMIQGVTQYRAQLFLPSQTQSTKPIQAIVQSNLKGIAVNLPGPLGKKANETADFQLSMNMSADQPLKTKLSYNKLFTLAMILERKKQAINLVSANVHLGSGDADWQNQPGIVLTGNIDQIDWNTVQPYITQFLAKKTDTQVVAKPLINPDMFRGVDVKINTLKLAGLTLDQIRVQLAKLPNGFQLNLTNAEIAGQINVPLSGMVYAKFSRLHFDPSLVSGVQSKIDPRSLPAISFAGEDVRYADADFGRVSFRLVPTRSGAMIQQFSSSSNAYQLNARGEWLDARSHLVGDITTTNVSNALKAWGLASTNLVGSKGNARFDLTWPGAPYRPSLPGLSGKVSLNLGEGRIINLSDSADAKMGLGRILNVLSLQSLPRRLSLNFSDLFEQGYSFDSMKGDFTLKNGNADTQNTRLNGPIASIEMFGRIGLAAKDFDMKLRVAAHVTASLPVVAAIATANPIAGIAAWVVDKVVSPEVSKIATYEYSITGTWDKPVWTQAGGKNL